MKDGLVIIVADLGLHPFYICLVSGLFPPVGIMQTNDIMEVTLGR